MNSVVSVYDLKPRFQALLRPAIRRLDAIGVTPNVVTVVALAGSLVVGAAIALAPGRTELLALLPAWLFVRMALNAIDGMMAREVDKKSELGLVLNELGDVLSDLALYLPLALVRPPAAPAVVVFAATACVTELAGLLAPALGRARRFDGPMGKSDRALWVGALALAGALAPSTLAYWTPAFWLLGAACALTVVRRARGALRDG